MGANFVRRFSALLIGALMFSAPMLVRVSDAGAVTTQRSVVAGNYTVYTNWNGGGYQAFNMTLRRNHTGTTPMNDTIIWSITGRAFTMTIDGVNSYKGTTTKAGFNNRRNPGTVTSSNGGGSGVWYAVKTP